MSTAETQKAQEGRAAALKESQAMMDRGSWKREPAPILSLTDGDTVVMLTLLIHLAL